MRHTLISVILVLSLLVGCSVFFTACEQDASNAESSATEGESTEGGTNKTKAMDFTVYDGNGNAVRLSDYFGKPIVLNFWASWCGPCRREMPDFHEKYLELGDDVQFLMVNLTSGRETPASAQSFVAGSGYTFPVLYDTESEAATVYRVYSIPTTYFINADGYLVTRVSSAIDAATLQRGIDMILE